MKGFIVLVIGVFFVSSADAQVRKTKWGMTKTQVISTEQGKPSLNESNYLVYDISLSGYKTNLIYLFNPSGKMAAASYNLREEYASHNSHLTTYLDLLSKLKQKYGEGKPDIEWSNTLFQDDKEKWGLAIAAEHLTISNRWETDDTIIATEISGKNYEISVAIRYISKQSHYKVQTI
ncbi:hypothetical protein [Sphingobacterium sp. SGG-5]|uniref:hypothetical protein n=1 Tax=Sphingobacterium sp. SGG-5 TaxID=2710881 RepID=UPI0019D120D7|nr:hypothetical protein [Sphingobacterium sp. SGG-5]